MCHNNEVILIPYRLPQCRCPHHNGPVFEECITATAGAAGKQDDQDGSSSGGAASAGTGGSSAAAAASSRAAYPKKRPRADSDGGGLDSDRDAAPTKCPWGSDLKGEYGDLITKHLSVCPLHPVACPRKGCGAVVRRWALEKHALVCRANFEACSICGELVRPEDMAAHRTAAAETHVQILEQKLLERNAVITSQQLARSPDSIVWSLKTADLFSCCKKRGDFVSSEPFCVKGYGPVKLDLHGAGFKNDNKPEAGSDEFMGLFCERAAPYPKGPRERFEINFSSLRVVSGSRSDTKTSTPINVLHEKKNDSLEPGFGWATMTDLKISKIKQLEEITIRLQIIGVEVALRTV